MAHASVEAIGFAMAVFGWVLFGCWLVARGMKNGWPERLLIALALLTAAGAAAGVLAVMAVARGA